MRITLSYCQIEVDPPGEPRLHSCLKYCKVQPAHILKRFVPKLFYQVDTEFSVIILSPLNPVIAEYIQQKEGLR
jgi:hypothetical protein